MPSSLSTALATWAAQVRVEDLPDDIRTLTRQRILDVIGVALPSIDTAFGRSVHDAVRQLGVGDESTVLGFGSRLPANLIRTPFSFSSSRLLVRSDSLKPIRNLTSSAGRRQFSVENA